MPPPLLSATFLSHFFNRRESSNGPNSVPDSGDPEKMNPGSGSGQDQSFNLENNDRHYPDEFLDDFDELYQEDIIAPKGAEDGRLDRPGQGIPPITMTTALFSISTSVRPALPRCLVKFHEILFGTHHEREVHAPSYRSIPILSGTLIPFSILLEIPGLTDPWYVRTSNGQNVQTSKNSAILTVSLAFSVTLAVIANIALVTRFLEKAVKGSTIICIVALSLHDILNVVTLLIFGIEHRFGNDFTYGEAFWMTICSTIMSMTTNLTLISDFLRTPDLSAAGSGLTRKQRSLVIITIIFLVYLALGALITSLMMSLTFLNGLFFTVVTTLTIGFGDIVPKTSAQRIVVCFYAVFGIIILGAGVRLTSEAIIEGLEVGYRIRFQEYRRRRRERREREQIRRWKVAVEKRLVERGLHVWTADEPTIGSSPATRPTPTRRGTSGVGQAMYLNTEALPPEVLESAAQEAGVPAEKFIGPKSGRRDRQQKQHHHDSQQQQGDESQPSGSGRVPLDFTWTLDDGIRPEHKWRCVSWISSIWERIRQALRLRAQQAPSEELTHQPEDVMNVLKRDERRSLYIKLGVTWALFFTFWIIGSLIFSKTEKWSYGTAMYICFIAFTTIGYGDFAPRTALGRAIFILWALFGVGAMTVLFAVLSDVFSSGYRRVTHNKVFDRAVNRYCLNQDQAMIGKQGESYGHTLAEVEASLQSQLEQLPEMMLNEVPRLRDHTRYFLIANGLTDALSLHMVPMGRDEALKLSRENAIPKELKELLNEIAQEGGFEERQKREVWDDVHATNTLFVLSFEKGARRMVEAAELARDTLATRNQLREGVEELTVTNLVRP
ncbi:hypothetical protein BGW80DRAFT_1559693 [Lactifluus volemus]|nr:hypothetical protein BGW80DRAFT_1559693 [Lactifluus volemus]